MREEKSFSQRAFSIYMDIRKLQDKAKTIGKMLDDQLTVEGLFSIVLMAEFDNGRYYFRTQTNGNDTVKSPIGMFDREIDNDLKTVDQKIREYWGI